MSTATLATLLVIASTLGGVMVSGFSALGVTGKTPAQRFEALEKMERYSDSVHLVIIDSINKTHITMIDRNGHRVDTLTDLTQRMAAQQCLSNDPFVRKTVRDAQMPCARILHNLGIDQ